MEIFSPETILIGFFKGFFSQEEIYHGMKNEFIYDRNQNNDTLIIKMSESFNDETYDQLPALVVQEGGFSERIQIMDNRSWHRPVSGQQGHIATFYHPLTIHCLTKHKGTSKVLQAATTQSIISFRKALYEFGIDNISQIQGRPPRKISRQTDKVDSMYDAAISFQVKMDQIWLLEPRGDIEERIEISIASAINDIEFDENGNIVTPSEEWLEQCIQITEEKEDAE